MTSSIQNNPPIQSFIQPPFSHQPAKQGHDSFQQVTARIDQANISIVTEEGDVVTLSSASSQAQNYTSQRLFSKQGAGSIHTLSFLETENMALSIQGDLNEEELGDIRKLMEEMSGIADDFFSGDLANAMEGAMNLGDTGSIAGFSATFRHTASVSTQYAREGHPVPVLQPFNLSEDAEGNETLPAGLNKPYNYAELFRAQWEQIKEILEDVKSESKKEGATQQRAAQHVDTVGQMLKTAEETVARNPRLSPFILPVTNRVIDKAVLKNPEFLSTHPLVANRLKGDFHQRFNDWFPTSSVA